MEEPTISVYCCDYFPAITDDESSSFNKHIFVIEVSFGYDLTYQILRSYVDFVALDIGIRGTQSVQNLVLPLDNVSIVEKEINLGRYGYIPQKEKRKKTGQRVTRIIDENEETDDISVMTIAESLAQSTKSKFYWSAVGNNFLQEIKEENLKAKVDDLDFYLQDILSRDSLILSETFLFFLNPEILSMADIKNSPARSMRGGHYDVQNQELSVHELLLTGVKHTVCNVGKEITQPFIVGDGEVLVWKFCTLRYDISFNVEINGHCVSSCSRCNAHEKDQYGAVVYDGGGLCTLKWDNSYSLCK
jgi:hypothetical protein